MRTYASVLPYISSVQSTFGASPEHRSWTERLLHRYSLLVRDRVNGKVHNIKTLLSLNDTTGVEHLLSPFRVWASFCRHEGENNAVSSSHSSARTPRRKVWKAYYDVVSTVLYFRPEDPEQCRTFIVRFGLASLAEQSKEISDVELSYESLLLGETSFPKANEENPEVEMWTDQVMTNWAILCSPISHDEDLEKGGKPALSRRILAVSSTVPEA